MKIEQEKYTLQYAGENPWGGPQSLTLFSDANNSKLFVAQGFLGMGIFDPKTLEQVGRYNLYTDVSERNGGEDWFINMNVADKVQSGNLDACTGMPDYNQASYEIVNIWHGDDNTSATPWADFDRYGKFYYGALKVEVAKFDTNTTAYIAFGLGGMVAVDVTGYENATPRDANCSTSNGFLEGKYLGYVPGLPAHGAEEETGEQSQSLFPYFGAGKLVEAGIIDVKVDTTNKQVYMSDHFAGLMVIGNADQPSKWKGANAPYNNNTSGELGDHWPDYEFVKSYDMTPVTLDEEAMPKFIYEAPILLTTGEVNGHGNRFALSTTNFNSMATGQTDVVLSSGAGGLSFLDLSIGAENNFSVRAYFPTTNEVGAAADGSPTQAISIGHSEGVTSYASALFLADGPHGMSVWQIADENCTPTDDVHLVANTLQDEYPVEVNGTTIYPAPHAFDVVLDVPTRSALVMSQSRGVRRINVAQEGEIGIPLLLYPKATDIYEHNIDTGNVTDFLHMQDHAYGTAVNGTLAFTADGSNGLTVYDLSKDPTDATNSNNFVISNLGGDTNSQPDLGRVSGTALWKDATTGISYAFLAAGSRGIAVVNVSDAHNMTLVKIFEPIKIEDGKVGKADGKSVAVKVVGDHVFFT